MINIVFKKEQKRKEVMTWLLKQGTYKHMLEGMIQKKTAREWEIQTKSEAIVDKL